MFVSQESIKLGIIETYGIKKRVEAVRNCRKIGKVDMKHNSYMPKMKVDPESYVSPFYSSVPRLQLLMAIFKDGCGGWNSVCGRSCYGTALDATVLRVLTQGMSKCWMRTTLRVFRRSPACKDRSDFHVLFDKLIIYHILCTSLFYSLVIE